MAASGRFTRRVAPTAPSVGCRVQPTCVSLDQTVVGWGNPGAWWPGDGDHLIIETECSWSLRVGNFVG
jgi:hypothetical protein